MNTKIKYIIFVIVIGLLVWVLWPKSKPVIPTNAKIDSIHTEIEKIDSTYEKNYNIILHQSADSDVIFFSDYLRRFGVNIDSATETN